MNNSPSNSFLRMTFVNEILPKLSGSLGCWRHESELVVI